MYWFMRKCLDIYNFNIDGILWNKLNFNNSTHDLPFSEHSGFIHLDRCCYLIIGLVEKSTNKTSDKALIY